MSREPCNRCSHATWKKGRQSGVPWNVTTGQGSVTIINSLRLFNRFLQNVFTPKCLNTDRLAAFHLKWMLPLMPQVLLLKVWVSQMWKRVPALYNWAIISIQAALSWMDVRSWEQIRIWHPLRRLLVEYAWDTNSEFNVCVCVCVPWLYKDHLGYSCLLSRAAVIMKVEWFVKIQAWRFNPELNMSHKCSRQSVPACSMQGSMLPSVWVRMMG